MAGHSRLKDGVLSHAYVPAIPSHETRLCPLSEITGTSPVRTGLIRLKSARLSAVAMQVGAVGVEP